MKNAFSKTTLIIAMSIACGLSSSAIFAENSPLKTGSTPPANPGLNTQVLHQDLINVQKRMQAIAEAQNRAKTSTLYQQDPNIMQSMLSDTSKSKGQEANDNAVAQFTLDNVQKTLSYLPTNLLTTDDSSTNAKAVAEEQSKQSEDLNNYTQAIPASDSIYSNNQSVVTLSQSDDSLKSQLRKGDGLGAPSVLYDKSFDYTNLIQPTSYTPDQLTNAKNYINFAMESYNHPSDQINSTKFLNYLQGKSSKQKAQAYADFINSDAYKQYQLQQRSQMTQKTMSLYNLDYLVTERTPVKNLGAAANLKDKNGKPITDASPLQVESYIANHRTNSPQWYAHVQSASPAAVQRETLVVLSEIESQNYQAHLDRERIIGLLASQSTQTSALQSSVLKSGTTNVNNAIDEIVSGGNGDPDADQNTDYVPPKNSADDKNK